MVKWHWIGVVVGMWSFAAQAQQPFEIGARPGWTLLAGPTVGLCVSGTSCIDGVSGFLGAELSISRVMEGVWYGLFTDSVWDFGTDAIWIHAGPEFGYGPIGIDGGVSVALLDEVQYGLNVRGILTAGILGFYVRYTLLPGLDDEHGVLAGMMVKLPIWASAGEFE